MKSNIHRRFLAGSVRQLERKTSGALWLPGCLAVLSGHSGTLALHHPEPGRKPTVGSCVHENWKRMPTVEDAGKVRAGVNQHYEASKEKIITGD